ncbi:gamma-glutamylcyclotransferase family protein [Bacillus sp. CGMCC 1.16541]|uniref:gamma-glutamylcyclotransferase n=1 Tax=Bacillus sp. CGMCC 1.16541 TaxID=2185143 RepID=UPI000D733E88|nr:gamma-glutamylcyclotransferase family protein [Bacillus sp. CGMCC 1.16541]
MTHYVFVYGTLRKGESNHDLLKDAHLVAEQAYTKGVLYDSGRGYPAMTVGEGVVYGELYEVNDFELKALDQLEGYEGEGSPNNEYERIAQDIQTDVSTIEAMVYVVGEQSPLLETQIPRGDWRIWNVDTTGETLYFAYGSCMDTERFTLQGVAQHFTDLLGMAKLPRYTLRFNHPRPDGGRADIVEEGGEVEGKLYRVPQEAVEYLYVREGVETNSYRPALISVEHNGKVLHNVLTFFVLDKQPDLAPPDHYATEILRGGAGTLSEAYLQKIQHYIDSL